MTDNIVELRTFFDEAGIKYLCDEPLSAHSTFKIGGAAALVVFPSDARQLTDILSAVTKYGVKYTVIGNGSNLLFSDGGFDGLVISTVSISTIHISGNMISVGCGASLNRLALSAGRQGLAGLEFAYGIPGTCGGAVFMNAGAYGSQMSEVLTGAECYDTVKGTALRLDKNEMMLSYRHSIFMEHPEWIILHAELTLTYGEPSVITSLMNENMKKRRDKQPLEYPSAGSVFKRRDGYYMGRIIEECGLKGFGIGGARVSDKHAGFIVNRGGATASDVLALIEHIKAVIIKEYGFEPECEIRYIS